MGNVVEDAKRQVGVLATLIIIIYVANRTMKSLRREFPLLDEEIRKMQRMVLGGSAILTLLAFAAYSILQT